MVLLKTERLFLREWVPDDWKRYKPLATDPRVLRYIGGGVPSSDERIKRFVWGGIEKAKTRGWILWPVIHREDAELIGFCGFGDGFPPDVEIGWRLRPEYWGHGLATEIARAVMEYGWERFRFERLISVIHPGNRASIRVAEKLGMTREATFTHLGVEVLRYAKGNPHLVQKDI
jgi:ribosomal-protein-alanine N-acetyltransferase